MAVCYIGNNVKPHRFTKYGRINLMVTLHDVAKKAGVSATTVSRVVNKKHLNKISSATQTRVLAAIEELGYRPNLSARGLRLKSTFNFGLVLQNVDISFNSNIVAGIQRVAIAEDYGCMLYSTFNNAQVEDEVFRTLIRKHVDGVIWVPGTEMSPTLSTHLSHKPVLQLLYKEIADLPAILVDQHQGERMATNHLIALGHRHIGCVTSPTRHGRQRFAGYCEAMEQAGLNVEPDLVLEVHDWEDGYYGVYQLLRQRRDITALVACNDIVALRVMRAVQSLGLRIPEDISVVGFDDMPLLYHLDKPLTTVAQPKEELGELALRTLIHMIKGQDQPDITLQPRLLQRATTAGPRAETYLEISRSD
jgi:DNA-binding LacI/PurR family transcriptional regulator